MPDRLSIVYHPGHGKNEQAVKIRYTSCDWQLFVNVNGHEVISFYSPKFIDISYIALLNVDCHTVSRQKDSI